MVTHPELRAEHLELGERDQRARQDIMAKHREGIAVTETDVARLDSIDSSTCRGRPIWARRRKTGNEVGKIAEGLRLFSGFRRRRVGVSINDSPPKHLWPHDRSDIAEPTHTTDLARVRDILVEADYEGRIVLEYESENPHDRIPGVLDRMKSLF